MDLRVHFLGAIAIQILKLKKKGFFFYADLANV